MAYTPDELRQKLKQSVGGSLSLPLADLPLKGDSAEFGRCLPERTVRIKVTAANGLQASGTVQVRLGAVAQSFACTLAFTESGNTVTGMTLKATLPQRSWMTTVGVTAPELTLTADNSKARAELATTLTLPGGLGSTRLTARTADALRRWTLTASDTKIRLSRMADLNPLVGAKTSDPAVFALPQLTGVTWGAPDLTDVALTLALGHDQPTPLLPALAVGVGGQASLQVLPGLVEMKNLRVEFSVSRPTDAERRVRATVAALARWADKADIDAEVEWPRGDFSAGLTRPAKLRALLTPFGLDQAVPDVDVDAARIWADLKQTEGKQRPFRVQFATGSWKVAGDEFALRNVLLDASGTGGTLGDVALTAVTSVGTTGRVTLEAAYAKKDTTWRFLGKGHDLKPAQLLEPFGVQSPKELEGLTVKDVTVEFDHPFTALTVGCLADVTIGGAEAVLEVRIRISKKTGSYTSQVSGLLHVTVPASKDRPARDLVLTVSAQGGGSLTASWEAGEGGALPFGDLARALGVPDPGVAGVEALGLRRIALTADKTGAAWAADSDRGRISGALLSGAPSPAVVAAEARMSAGLSNLPVVGAHIPRDVDVRISAVRVLAARPAFTEDQAKTASALLKRVHTSDPPAITPGLTLSYELRVRVGAESRWLASTKKKQVLAVRDESPVPIGDGTDPTVWYDLGRAVGPVRVERLGVRVAAGRLWLLVDAGMDASGLSVLGRGMGIGFSPGTPERISVCIEGLGIAYSRAPVQVAGMLVYRQAAGYDLVVEGGAVVVTPALGAQAAGRYAKPTGRPPSLFLFARLGTNNGQGIGPPPFRITGGAAGFGYNSTVRPVALEEVSDFPLMPGHSSEHGDPLKALTALTGGSNPWIRDAQGQVWLAAGLDFNSFSLLDGQALALVEFSTSGGRNFSVGVFGRLGAKFPPSKSVKTSFARVDLVLAATYSGREDVLRVFAAIAPGSFVVHESCTLSGDAALCVWFGASAHPGDFVFSVGGYHPHYPVPGHYPLPRRLSLAWTPSDSVTLRGSAYAALTPSAFMLGTKTEISYSSGPVEASCEVEIHALVQWEPFSYWVTVRVLIRAKINVLVTLRGEKKVDLELWGPPTGGIATARICGYGVHIKFGEPRPTSPRYLDIDTFRKQLLDRTVVQVLPEEGLLPTAKETPEPGQPWYLDRTGFAFQCRSSVPLGTVTLPLGRVQGKDAYDTHTGRGKSELSIRPVGAASFASECSVTLRHQGGLFDFRSRGWTVELVDSPVPRALWGSPLGAGERPALPDPEQERLDRTSGVRVRAPRPSEPVPRYTTSEHALGTEVEYGPRLPSAGSAPKGPTRPQDAREQVRKRLAADQANTERRSLISLLSQSGVVPSGATPLANDPLTGYVNDLHAHLRSEPLTLSGKETSTS
ncbi:DUF6603 domain-containing protein [Nocardiopsis dassonvillei]|uniref:DUF6603 domain-containing protein n=1 Tax=Nocardiopsis dassonvillei TaxID=2014 RepID=UPI00366AD0C5